MTLPWVRGWRRRGWGAVRAPSPDRPTATDRPVGRSEPRPRRSIRISSGDHTCDICPLAGCGGGWLVGWWLRLLVRMRHASPRRASAREGPWAVLSVSSCEIESARTRFPNARAHARAHRERHTPVIRLKVFDTHLPGRGDVSWWLGYREEGGAGRGASWQCAREAGRELAVRARTRQPRARAWVGGRGGDWGARVCTAAEGAPPTPAASSAGAP